ncbi:MAG: hypothetical protein Q7L07_13200 [Pseudohongiella sp.]|nr:hypothetical protein [Pseudohongiella sp.]
MSKPLKKTATAATIAIALGAANTDVGAAAETLQNTAADTSAPTPGETSAQGATSTENTTESGTEEAAVVRAAQFAGVAVDQVYAFRELPDNRFVVVTRSGRKIDQTPAERAQAARQAAAEAAAKAAQKTAKAAR